MSNKQRYSGQSDYKMPNKKNLKRSVTSVILDSDIKILSNPELADVCSKQTRDANQNDSWSILKNVKNLLAG